MATLSVFNQVTLDGYFSGPGGDIAWAHKSDPEWMEFVSGNASSGGTLLFGRKTYEMMVSYWPTARAKAENPAVAKGMNAAQKVVFSRTLRDVPWENTRLVKDDLEGEIRRLKGAGEGTLAILGSGTLVAQLAAAGLVDRYQIVVNPVVLGAGRTLFEGIRAPLRFERRAVRAFQNGSVLFDCAPARAEER